MKVSNKRLPQIRKTLFNTSGSLWFVIAFSCQNFRDRLEKSTKFSSTYNFRPYQTNTSVYTLRMSVVSETNLFGTFIRYSSTKYIIHFFALVA